MRGVSVLERSRSGMLWGKGLGKRGWRMMGWWNGMLGKWEAGFE